MLACNVCFGNAKNKIVNVGLSINVDKQLVKFWKRVSDSTGIPLDGLSFIYDASTFTQLSNIDQPNNVETQIRHFTAADYCTSFVRLAQEKFGADYVAALNSWHLDTSEKLGQAFYALISRNLMLRQESDSQSDFDGQYSFSTTVSEPSLEAYYYPLTALPDYRNKWWIKVFNKLERVLRAIIILSLFIGFAVWIAQFTKPIPGIVIFFALILAATFIRSRIQYPYQFSLRTLLIATTLAAVVLGVVVWAVR